jgi:hypothetical protein
LASQAHRVKKGLVGGCALLLGVAVAVSGCAAPQYTYIGNSNENTYFKVPYSWHKISDSSLASELKATNGGGAGWTTAYQAGTEPTAKDFLGFNLGKPFVFAEIGALTSTETSEMSDAALRDIFLPVSSSARSTAAEEGFALTNFKQIRDETLKLSQGVHGVREIFDYTYTGNVTDTFDEVALTNSAQNTVYLLVLHCTTSCYSSDQTQINDVMSSFTIRSP